MELKQLIKKKSDIRKISPLLEESYTFLKDLENQSGNIDEFLKDNSILKVRRQSLEFVKNKLNKLNKWDLRLLNAQLFDRLNINMEEDTPLKFIFLLFTDAVCEVNPEAVPLVFFYNGYPIVKKHGIVIDFDVLPFMVQTADEMSPEKKHQLVLSLYREDELILNGISKYLSDLNFLILNLLDKVLYAEIIPFEEVVVKKEVGLQPDLENIKLIIKGVFSALVETFLNKKENLSGILNKKHAGYFTKVKNYIKSVLKDKEEVDYLKETAEADEESIENRILAVKDYENQKNVFEESLKREDIPVPERIENIFWLLGIENANPVLLLRYYDTDDTVYFLHSLLRQAQDEGFLTQELKEGIKGFFYKLFQYPYLSKGMINKKTLDKPVKLLFDNENLLKANYYYFTRRYTEFLEIEKQVKEKTPELRLRQLMSKFFTGEFSKDELTGWLSLEKSKEGQFFYHLFTDSLDSISSENEYRYVADLYTVKASVEEVSNVIGEEGVYTLILRLLGFYPYDKTLVNLLNLRFS